jgi:hypothetical protein
VLQRGVADCVKEDTMDPSLFVAPSNLQLMGLICHYCNLVPLRPTYLLHTDTRACLGSYCDTCLETNKPTVCPKCSSPGVVPAPDDLRMTIFLGTQEVKCPNHVKGCRAVSKLKIDGEEEGNFFTSHLKTCDFEQEECVFCAEKFFPSVMESHKFVCPKAPGDCKFVRLGCELGKGIPRENLAAHETEFFQKHFAMLLKTYVEKVPDAMPAEEVPTLVTWIENFHFPAVNVAVTTNGRSPKHGRSPKKITSPAPPPPFMYPTGSVEHSPIQKKRRKRKSESSSHSDDEEGSKKRPRAKPYKFGEELAFSRGAQKATRGRKKPGVLRGRPRKVESVPGHENGTHDEVETPAAAETEAGTEAETTVAPEPGSKALTDTMLMKELIALIKYIENALPWDATNWRLWKEQRDKWESKLEYAEKPEDFLEPIWELHDIILEEQIDRQKMLTPSEDPAKLLGMLESAIRWEKSNTEWYPKWRNNFLTRLYACQDAMSSKKSQEEEDHDESDDE